MTAFEEFGVIPELAKAVDEMEWLLPTDVQAEAIPMILGGEKTIFLVISQIFIIISYRR
jgi:superfamily II DNA/RNA helicase